MKIEIQTGGAAFHSEFDEDCGDSEVLACELERLFKKIVKDVKNSNDSGVLIDTNGNRCGRWSL